MAIQGGQVRRGPLTMLVGFALLGVVPIMVKSLREVGWDAPHTVVARFAIACLFVGAVVLARRRLLSANNKSLLLLRGVLGGAAVMLYFTSVQLAGAGAGTLLNYTYPVWANLFGVLFLRQRPSAWFWGLLASALLGVYLVIDPEWKELHWGELAGAISGMLAGAAVLCIKQLRETNDSLIIIWSFSVVGLLFALPIAIFATPTPVADLPWESRQGWLLLTSTGVFSFLGHVYFTRGYKHTSLQLGSLLALTVPVIAVLLGWLLLDEALSPRFVSGGALILAASAGLGTLERRSAGKP